MIGGLIEFGEKLLVSILSGSIFPIEYFPQCRIMPGNLGM